MVGYSLDRSASTSDRVCQTVALLQRRGYALAADRLGELCIGGAVSEAEVRWAVAASPDLTFAQELVVERSAVDRASDIRSRALTHEADAAHYLQMTMRFVRTLVAVAPFIRSVSVAGSLASGGFRASDDVDLNLIVDDGHRHLAYVIVNVLGLAHALAHRAKPVDDLTRRPLAPRLMTANLILELSQCHPLERTDEDMAYELLVAEPLFGRDVIKHVLDANPALLEHFPQLAYKPASMLIDPPRRRLPAALFPTQIDGGARRLGETAWRYMQWTRRTRPEALARVAFVRATMRPYALFDGDTNPG
ncbi:MAG TPA: hypothetical protein VGU71_20855 [Candidatus Dormibacteraeota bacterium]|nr:hypothetical protein [Candidatus Dormibacteraeota bacterium]